MTFTGRVYGIVVASQDALPGVAPARGDPEVRITRVDEASRFEEARAQMGEELTWFTWTRLADGRDYLRYRDAFEFLVAADGTSIIGHALKEVDPETYAVYLLNQALSFALLRLGREPLHATVIEDGGRAVALLGAPGAGKTSLAAAMLASGARLVTDDLLVVRWGAQGPFAQAGPARLKVLPDTARRWLPDLAQGVPMNPDTHKQVVRLPDRLRSAAEAPLRLIAVLRPPRPGRVVLRASAPRAAMLDLVANTFNPVVTDRDRLAEQFAHDAKLVRSVPCVSVSTAHDWGAATTVAARLRARLSAEPEPAGAGSLSGP